jgi:hypothetical protein
MLSRTISALTNLSKAQGKSGWSILGYWGSDLRGTGTVLSSRSRWPGRGRLPLTRIVALVPAIAFQFLLTGSGVRVRQSAEETGRRSRSRWILRTYSASEASLKSFQLAWRLELHPTRQLERAVEDELPVSESTVCEYAFRHLFADFFSAS